MNHALAVEVKIILQDTQTTQLIVLDVNIQNIQMEKNLQQLEDQAN